MIIVAPYRTHFFCQMVRELPNFIETRIVPVSYCQNRFWLPTSRMFNIIKEFKPNVVLTDYPGYPGLYAKFYQFVSRHKIPLLTRLRGNRWIESKLAYHYFGFKGKLQLKTLVNPRESLSLKLSDQILPICKWLEEEVKQQLPKKRTKVVYQGVDPDFWQMTCPLEGIESPAVGILQNYNISLKIKGLIQFLEIIKDMQDVNFYLAGEGAFKPLITKKCSRLKNAFTLPRISPKLCRRFYSSIDVYVLASGLDCCPTTVLEASLIEKPVVASRIGGIPELIQDGRTGWTIKNEVKDMWKAKIRTLLEDERLAKTLGKNGREFVTKHFSWKVISKDYLSAILETLNE